MLEKLLSLRGTQQCKVIQLYVNDTPKLILSKRGTDHNVILKQYLDEHKLEYSTCQINGVTLPSHLSEQYKVVGMGFCSVRSRKGKKTVNLFGDSFIYNMGIDSEHIEDYRNLVDENVELSVIRN